MKAITEEMLRYQLRKSQPEVFIVPEGSILTPAAKEFLQQKKVRYRMKSDFHEQEASTGKKTSLTNSGSESENSETALPVEPAGAEKDGEQKKPKYRDHVTGAYYFEKPEQMTQLFGNELVFKDDPKIIFRGKLDSAQSLIVLAQAVIHENGCDSLVFELNDILKHLREVMRCDVLAEELPVMTTIGLTHSELRERSHNPMKYYKIRQMLLPDYTMGINYAYLNQIRTKIRETELAACMAFREGGKYTRKDLIEELNRLSSAMHIMMCRYLAGEYIGGGR